MCDCPEDKEDGEKKVETVMLFKKCQKPYRTTKDIVKPSSYDTVSDKDLWTPADSSQSTFRYTCDSPKGSQLTSSFTSSSKIVNFSLFLPILHNFSHIRYVTSDNPTYPFFLSLFSFLFFSFPPDLTSSKTTSTNSSHLEATNTWGRGKRNGVRRSPTSRASRTRWWGRRRGSTSSAH